MIESISGLIQECFEQSLSVGTSAGISYEILVTNIQRYTVGDSVTFFTHLQWNQETGPSLYGFSTRPERQVFRILIDCNGIGPKLGLGILSQLSINELVSIVHRQDDGALSSLHGIGKKKAEQIIVALKHKVDKFGAVSMGDDGVDTRQLVEVLTSLNYSKIEIQAAVHAVHEKCNKTSSVRFDEQMRVALSHLAHYKTINK
jgi:Holliday junction DNA helicase RuvA